ncbi:hypothetical protein J8G26_08935 [Acidovorax sp. JG5]|uniref:hypothetical protein n=1 Tax=Acidovorax sp. JG5 TaxID=2822718 RepID=UPI001B343DCE|nr:hypothetical protein [Acidovorax sp. JG5]MBP3980851.1 hypothetical protein [Acidovorax sp. JG5]
MSDTKYLSGSEFKLHFRDLLASLKDDDQITFGAGDLSFLALRERGTKVGQRVVQIEFNETYTVTSG